MLALQINNPEIESLFKTKFNGNKENFINFIRDSLQSLEASDTFQFKKLDPKQNSYTLLIDNESNHLSNPFENVDDVLSFSASLRTNSYR